MPNNIIEKLKLASDSIFSGYPVLFAYIYGSYATGSTHPFSDLDIGIYIEPEFANHTLEIELDLALEIDKLLDHKIETDVRAINNMPLTFLGRVLAESIVMYSRDESARIEFEVCMRKKYFDFMPIIQNYHKAYISAVLQ